MSRKETELARFVAWARRRLPEMRGDDGREVAAAVDAELRRVDGRLGVEVAKLVSGVERELVVTAFSDRTAFAIVRDVVDAVGAIPGWRLSALKPPRGFAFKLSIGGVVLDANSLAFSGMPGLAGGIQLGLDQSVYARMPKGRQAQELAWLIVETGVGEELSSGVTHVEFVAKSSLWVGTSMSLLDGYLRARRNTSL